MDIEFHRLEETGDLSYTYIPNSKITTSQRVVCSFKTDRLGIVQVGATNEHKKEKCIKNIDISFSTVEHEPDFNVLAESEQAYVKKYMTAVLLLTFYPHELVN